MRLYDYAASCNAYKIRLLIAQLGLDVERIEVDIFDGATLTDAFGALNPARTVPVLDLGDGRVQVVAEGPKERCDALLDWLRTGDTPGRVDGVTEIWATPRGGYDGFEIR